MYNVYVACILFSCTYGGTYVLRASIQLCFHDFKANIKVVLTTLMTWQTFQGEMRERKSKRLFFSNSATDSIISVEITDQHWALLLQLVHNALNLFPNAALLLSSENYFRVWR